MKLGLEDNMHVVSHIAPQGQGTPKIHRSYGQKGTTKVRGSTKICKALLVNYTHGRATGVLFSYDINTLQWILSKE